MKKFILLTIVLFTLSFPTQILSQDIPKKISKKICKCLEKEKVTNMDDIQPCFEQTLLKNLENLYDYYDVKTLESIDFDKLGVEIATFLSKKCDYFIPFMAYPENKFKEDFTPEKNLDCSELKAGDFYYLTPNILTKQKDTTFLTIKDSMYLERMENGKKYALLDIKWTNDCQFELIFKNSNDNYKNALSEKGDIYYYEMVSSTPNSFIIKMTWEKQVYRFEIFKSN